MPAPAVYALFAVVGVVAVAVAFKEFVYEPHIAPQVEAWAEDFVERRRQRRRQRQGPVPAQPVNEHRDENRSRRSSDSSDNGRDMGNMSIELEQLAARERDEWRHPDSSGLRRRRTAGALDESNTLIPHPIMEPTHVLFNMSEPPSPGGHSIRTSAPSSLDNSPAQPVIVLQPVPVVSSPPPRAMSPRLLPTPISNYSGPSTPLMTPTSTLSERSPLSSRNPTPDLAASQALSSMSAYNTPLGGSMVLEHGPALSETLSPSSSRIQSPFSDIHEVDARSPSPEHIDHPLASRPSSTSPRAQSPSVISDISMDSDDDFDVLSPRSAIFSPQNRVEDDLFDIGSQHGSERSWASVGRHSPIDF